MSIKNGYVFNKDSIEYLCKIVRDMNTISDGISDINIASNSTFSSLKIDNLIKQAIEDNNEYTDRVVSALTHLVAEKIDFEPTLDNTADKKNTLLLYSVNSNTTFNQYLRLENELLDLGTTSMDLSSYYTITQADSKFILKTEYDSLVSSINDINDTLGDEALTTTSQTVTEAINELVKARTNMEIIDLQGGSVLDYAKTFDALTYNSFYANNCYDLPNNENYGYCYVEVSQDPLYRNINFTSPTTGRKYTNTIGASTVDPTIFGEWSGWHEELIKEDVVSVLDDTVTDEQIPSAKAVNSQLDEMKRNFQDGVDTVYDAVVAKGATPVDKTPLEIAIAISKKLGDLTSIYNALTDKGLTMSRTESDSQVATIISDLLTLNSFTTKTDSNTFVFNGTKEIIKETELVDISSGLILEFNSEELTSVESGDYIEFAEIDKTEYNNKLKFM